MLHYIIVLLSFQNLFEFIQTETQKTNRTSRLWIHFD